MPKPPTLHLYGQISTDTLSELMELKPGSSGHLYIDCSGGNSYTAVAITNLIRLRGLRLTATVLGECSSAALWPFAACIERRVASSSVLLFHPLSWESGALTPAEGEEWARHYVAWRRQSEQLLARLFGIDQDTLKGWTYPGTFFLGREFAKTGLAELLDLPDLTN